MPNFKYPKNLIVKSFYVVRYKLMVYSLTPKRFWFRLLSTFTNVKNRSTCLLPTLFNGSGLIQVGSGVSLGVVNSPYYFSAYNYIEARSDSARVVIEDGVQINNNFVCIAESTEITISENALIGFNVQIYDSNFHDLNPLHRHKTDPNPKSVLIGKNVFVGSNVTILKGVIIGDNSIVGAGSVVTQSIPANCIATGNPAKFFERH